MKFELGQTVATRQVVNCMENEKFRKFVNESFKRYCNGDWGDLSEGDKQANDDAIKNGDDMIFASYDWDGMEYESIYIITEYDRSATTILFKSEY